jgi:hypothetical protein
MFVKAVGKPLEILAKLNELAGFPENEEIELFEVLIPMHHFLYHFPKFELAGFPILGFFLDFCILYSLYQVWMTTGAFAETIFLEITIILLAFFLFAGDQIWAKHHVWTNRQENQFQK